MSTTLEAKLRIIADTAQSVLAMKDLQRATADVGQAARTAGKAPLDGIAQSARAAADAQREVARQARIAARETADAQAKASRAAARTGALVGPQITDIVTGLATGQSPLTVLLQQGGQLRDVFGGFGNALRAVGAVLTPTRLAFGGLAAALGAVVLAAVDGARENDALQKGLALTGNTAGRTAGNLDELARRIAQTQRVSIGDARATVQALAISGDQTTVTFEAAARAATSLGKATGQTAQEVAKDLASLNGNVAAGAVKLNQQFNFLTATQYEYIRSLEAAGRPQEALRVTLEALSAAIEQRHEPSVGKLERAWDRFTQSLSYAWDRLKKVVQDETVDDRIARLTEQLGRLDKLDPRLRSTEVRKPEIDKVRQDLEDATRQKNADLLRANERAVALQAEKDAIEKAGKAYQDALAAVDAAGAQKLLAQTLAGLDAKKAAIEHQRAQDIIGEREYNLALNAIEQQRLQAQAANLQKQIAIEQGRVVEKPTDQFAKDARVKAIEAQLVDVRSRISTAQAAAIDIATADALTVARQRAADWAAVWQRANDQVRTLAQQNAGAGALRLVDPVARAKAEADVATRELRRQVAELQRDLELRLSLTVDPGQRAELQQQVAALARESAAAIDQQTRTTTFDSLKRQFAELNDQLSQAEQALATQVEQGALTTEQAEQRKLEARAQAIPQLQAILDLLERIGQTPDERNAVAAAANTLAQVKDLRTELDKTAKSAGISAVSTALSDIETGAKSGKQALLDMVGSFAKAMLDVINQRLAEQLVNSLIPSTSSGGIGGLVSSVASFFGFHTGGVLGSDRRMRIAADPAVFSLAPRYHSGGVLGLAPGEMPLIGKVGEEMLTEDNPRHIKNFKGFGGVTVNSNVTINGASGDANSQRGAVDDLARTLDSAMNEWAVRQKRPGGLLARG